MRVRKLDPDPAKTECGEARKNLLRSLSFNNLRFHFPPVGLQKYQVTAFDCGLNGVTDDETLSDITCMSADAVSR